MKYILILLSTFAVLLCGQARADNMASITISPSTGVVSLVPRWSIGGSLAGFHYMAQDLPLGGGPSLFYSLKGTTIPGVGDTSAFTHYIIGSGAATTHADIGSKLTPDAYLALTSADPDLGYGAINFYTIHRKATGDYFTTIVPGSGTSSAVTDLKPMSGPGGPSTPGASGYFGLTFAAPDLGYGANFMYYLRTDSVSGFTRFGSLNPALVGPSVDLFDLGTSGYKALAFTATDVGYGANKMYYMRLDPITGFTILGTLNPQSGLISDIANLGSVYSTLAFYPLDLGFGAAAFYTTGSVNPTWQSVSFAAIANRLISSGSFTVAPSASSGLPISLTVVSGSVGAASISGPVSGVYTVTPTAPGLITLQATQAGQASPTPYEYNMLRQSFTVTGSATLVITAQPTPQSAAPGATVNFSVSATGTTLPTYQWRKDGANIGGNASATTATLTLTNIQSGDAASYDVVVTNGSGSILSDSVTLTVLPPAPIITNDPLTDAGTVGTPFSFSITASGTPTSYSASPLPAGLAINTVTGSITGTPTTAGMTSVLLGATNATGTGNATLTVTVVAAGVAPIITNDPLTDAGTVGTPFSFSITASGTPTSYSASPLPAGLTINTVTGSITGTPTTAGMTSVLLGATNTTGTGNATLTVTVAAAGVAPIISNDPLTDAGTVGTPFSFSITASGTPTSYSASPLPAGLTINTVTGSITGTPTTAGMTSVLLGATNATGTGNATLTVTVAAAGVAPIITNDPLTDAGTVGTPFSFSITASGTPTSYSASPLPAGLTINTVTGSITGTPTTAGMTSVLLGATNATGTGNATLTVTVAAAGVAPIITNDPLTDAGTVGTPFSFIITASGTPTSYSASPLPAGLTINTVTGSITGTPTTVGMTSVLLGATNATGTGNATLTVTVAAAGVAPIISNDPLTDAGTVGTPFSFSITASGTPTSYSASPLPAGLIINTLTGSITGTPTTAGMTSVLLGATNATGTGNATLTVTVVAAGVAPIITNDPLTDAGTVGTPFSFSITASGTPTSYSASPLPAGLIINTVTGSITGTPTTAGVTSVLLGATNATGTGNATLTVTVATAGVAPIITNNPLTAAGTVSTPFSFNITASGLPTSYTASPLPAGLIINTLTGSITGTPATAGVTSVLLGATNAAGTGNATLTVTVAVAGVAPIITNNPLTAAGTVSTPFSFTITASGTPTNYSASPLPAGLTINTVTGSITGTPTTAGVTAALLTATNATGTGNATLTITVAAAGVAPIITNSPLTAAGTVSTPFSFTIIASGSPTSYSASPLPDGLIINTVTGSITGTPTTAGVTSVLLAATNAIGTGNATLTVTTAAANVPPVITSPTTASGTVAQPFTTYLIAATGSPTGYTATDLPSGLTLNSSTGAINGTPDIAGTSTVTLTASNAAGSSPFILTVTIAPEPIVPSSRIINFSARALSGPGNQTLIMGFIVSGDGMNLLLRGIGPTLASYGISRALPDPYLSLFNTVGVVARNDNWQSPITPELLGSATPADGSLIASTAAEVGAFALPNGSKDSALICAVEHGAHTAALLSTSSSAGIALTEIYTTNPAPGTRLLNVSARMNVTPGEGTLIAGLIISGNAPKTVLIRGVGPALSAYNVGDLLADPTVTVFSRDTQLAENDNWETGPSTAVLLKSTFLRVGAFPLPSGSKDAALLLTLEPGLYTIQVTGVGNTSGVALVEIYDAE